MNSDQIILKAKAIVERIERDIKDRPAFRQEWDQLTQTGRKFILGYWKSIVANELRGPARNVSKPRKITKP